MLTERLKTRLAKDRPTTSITLRIPVDVVESMKQIAPLRGLSGYQTLLKSYIGEGLRRDEAEFNLETRFRVRAERGADQQECGLALLKKAAGDEQA